MIGEIVKDNAEHKDRQHLEQACEVVRAEVKSARAPPVIETLQERDEHEVIPVAKLDRANDDLSEGDHEKKEEQINSPARARKNAGGEKVNDQPAED